MEICDQSIDHFKLVTRINKNFCPSTSSMENTIFISCGFQCTAACRSYGNYSSAVLFGIVDQFCLVFFYHIKFRMHMMTFYIVNFYRTKSTKTDMQSYMRNLYSFFFDLLHQFFRKMKTGCRSCRRTVILCINSLVTVFVF